MNGTFEMEGHKEKNVIKDNIINNTNHNNTTTMFSVLPQQSLDENSTNKTTH